MERQSFEIQNTDGLLAIGHELDTAKEVPMFYGETKENAERYKGIYNNGQNELAQVASQNYAIIQHRDVLDSVIRSLKSKNIDVFGRVDNFGNQVRMDLVFGNKSCPIKDDSKGVKLGIRVLNSYNKSTSFRLEMFGFRMICQNGMSLGKVMNSIKEVTFHVGQKSKEDIQAITEQFINKVINNSEALQLYVSDAIADSFAWENVTQLIQKYMPHKKHRSKICELLGITMIEKQDPQTKKKSFEYVLEKEGKNKISRWDFYNAITNYATHNKLGLGVENKMQEIAQNVLKNKSESLLEAVQVSA